MRTSLVMLVLLFVGAQSADAQRRRPSDNDGFDWWPAGPVQLGLRGGHSFDEVVGSAGAQLRIPIIRQVIVVPSGDVYLGDDAHSDWQLNGDLMIAPDGLGGLYGGGGAALLDHDPEEGETEEDEAEFGFNLFAGLDGGRLFGSSMEPFAEARWTFLEDFSPFRLIFGINVPVR